MRRRWDHALSALDAHKCSAYRLVNVLLLKQLQCQDSCEHRAAVPAWIWMPKLHALIWQGVTCRA